MTDGKSAPQNIQDAFLNTVRREKTSVTVYLLNGGLLEYAQRMAAHESSRTTKPYDRRNDQVTLDQADCALTEPINGMLQNGGERGF